MATKVSASGGAPRWKGRRYLYDPETGKTREKTRTFTRKRDAEHWEAVERERHRRNRTSGGDITLEAFVEARRDQLFYGLALQTSEAYASHLKRRILPDLGHFKLEDLTPAEIEKQQAKWAAHHSMATINGTRAALSWILKLAIKERRIDTNAVLLSAKPRASVARVTTQTLGETEITQLLHRLEQIGNVYRAYAATSVLSGLRAGEVAALTVGDIDLDRRIVHVRRSLAGGGRKVIQTPKSGQRRHVPLSRALQDELEPLLRDRPRSDQLFVTDRGWLTHQAFMREVSWQDLVQNIGVPGFRFHDLRATAIVRWLRAGVSTAVVRTWAGHADLATTTVYARLAGTDDADSLARVDAADMALLGPART